jgi:hypothetical protein
VEEDNFEPGVRSIFFIFAVRWSLTQADDDFTPKSPSFCFCFCSFSLACLLSDERRADYTTYLLSFPSWLLNLRWVTQVALLAYSCLTTTANCLPQPWAF